MHHSVQSDAYSFITFYLNPHKHTDFVCMDGMGLMHAPITYPNSAPVGLWCKTKNTKEVKILFEILLSSLRTYSCGMNKESANIQ